MKDMLVTLFRHALTALAGVGTLLAGRGWIAPEDAEAVNASGASLREALVVVLVAVVARLAMVLGGKFLKVSGKDNTGIHLWLLFLGTVALAGALPSCTAAQRDAFRDVPVKACVRDEDGRGVCYSTTDGIVVDYHSAK